MCSSNKSIHVYKVPIIYKAVQIGQLDLRTSYQGDVITSFFHFNINPSFFHFNINTVKDFEYISYISLALKTFTLSKTLNTNFIYRLHSKLFVNLPGGMEMV